VLPAIAAAEGTKNRKGRNDQPRTRDSTRVNENLKKIGQAV
jgi:hypothetical protein